MFDPHGDEVVGAIAISACFNDVGFGGNVCRVVHWEAGDSVKFDAFAFAIVVVVWHFIVFACFVGVHEEKIVELNVLKINGMVHPDMDGPLNWLVVFCRWAAGDNDDVFPRVYALELRKCLLMHCKSGKVVLLDARNVFKQVGTEGSDAPANDVS